MFLINFDGMYNKDIPVSFVHLIRLYIFGVWTIEDKKKTKIADC